MNASKALHFYGMIPMLRAKENINDSTVIMLGSGLLQQADRRRIMASWEQLAASDREGKEPAKTQDDVIKRAVALGIAVEIVD